MLRLCQDLGKTRSELLSQMGSRELTDWMAYYRLANKPADDTPPQLSLEDEKALMREELGLG